MKHKLLFKYLNLHHTTTSTIFKVILNNYRYNIHIYTTQSQHPLVQYNYCNIHQTPRAATCIPKSITTTSSTTVHNEQWKPHHVHQTTTTKRTQSTTTLRNTLHNMLITSRTEVACYGLRESHLTT